MQVALSGLARSCSAIHVRGTNLFGKIEMRFGFERREWNDEERETDFVSSMNGETFYLFVGTMAYGALGVLIAFAGT